MDIKSRIVGSIVGGAVGDALGYPVEFMKYDEIVDKLGERGIIEYPFSKGYISDDTQMTLFTIEGLLKENNAKSFSEELDIYKRNIYDSYLDWYSSLGFQSIFMLFQQDCLTRKQCVLRSQYSLL